MSVRYADIIIDISHEKIDRTFQYKIPEALDSVIQVGDLVNIPFGKGNNVRSGYVIQITDTPNWDVDKIKEIIEIDNKAIGIDGYLIKLAAWMKNTYGSTMINCLKTVMPVKAKVGKRTVKKQFMDVHSEEILPVTMNEMQKNIVNEFTADYDKGDRKTYLLHGVTGSGKTEVYINAVREVVARGKKAILLIPEIALTYQTVMRFRTYFGDRISIINSQLSAGEKYREFMRAKNGETDVMIGPRSALFAPFDNLGLIIIDEEHDGAYKSEMPPKYSAIETARYRAYLQDASVILGSATPSIKDFYKAENGIYKLWTLDKRAGDAELAEVFVVDMREELRKGNRNIFSGELYSRIGNALANNEQIMLFINRRGFNSIVSCRNCGTVIKCPKCDVSLTLHMRPDREAYMLCHYCGHTEPVRSSCPDCSSEFIGGFGTGTEKVEEELKRLFPTIRTLRMDRDTTEKKGAVNEIITKFRNKEADCLIGTQMIVKGHDFGDVTVVGIMLADLTLFESDYEAGERTFQLLTQAAGRAGRKDKKGSVVIQTYKPLHYAITTSSSQNYKEFYETEMAYRTILNYPPKSRMMEILITSKNAEFADKVAGEIAAAITKKSESSSVIGPSEAFIGRINEIYRRVVYVKNIQYNELILARVVAEELVDKKYKDTDCQIQFDFT